MYAKNFDNFTVSEMNNDTISMSGSKDTNKKPIVGRNIELTVEASSRSNCFSAIPCKEIKLNQKRVTSNIPNQVMGPQDQR